MTQEVEILETSNIPDGGWGWVIVAASFMLRFFGWFEVTLINILECYLCVSNNSVQGINRTSGLFLAEYMETFGTDHSVTSMVSSTQMMVGLLVGPIAAQLIDRFGCRKTAITGTILATTGLVTSGMAPNFAILWITSGLLTGNTTQEIYLSLFIKEFLVLHNRYRIWLHILIICSYLDIIL